ncbi:MAG: formate--tetrahydrofolate ligase [Clostridiales bacterium]|nr:formate--tetrahydrofolate ligase [Clostridiales bacterium]
MKTDIEIANECEIKKIEEIANKINIPDDALELYGKYKAKIDVSKISGENKAKLILVTAINPTPYGEGKTTVSIGLGDALNKIGENCLMVLREPSLGPVFGVKGGATGGGYSQVIPMEDINLHFNGDFHAITTANNLLCAAIDNHIMQGNSLNIDPNEIKFYRTMDMNDRALREIVVGIGEKNGVERKDKFNITAASEIMTIFCLAKDIQDLKERLDNILIGYTYDKKPVYAKELNVTGSMTVLLKEAIKPNLVQTLEANPVIIHGGPFANIAHGCNTIIATKLGMKLADYVVTEAGFGADLGAEKFLDIKCRKAELKPDCVVLVSTIKALKYNAGVEKKDILNENVEAVKKGLCNLEVHVENMKKYGVNLVVCINKYNTDTDDEIDVVLEYCRENNIKVSLSEAYVKGGEGAIDLARKVIEECNKENNFKLLYDENDDIKNKIEKICKEIYRAGNVIYTQKAEKEIDNIKAIGKYNLPICIAKTQYSISDDKNKLGKPEGYDITVKDVRLYSGAGFITVLLGDIMTMPGLPKVPSYEKIYIDENEKIVGIF